MRCEQRGLVLALPARGKRQAGPVLGKTPSTPFPEDEARDALRYIQVRRVDPKLAAFLAAPIDDEPVTDEEERAVGGTRGIPPRRGGCRSSARCGRATAAPPVVRRTVRVHSETLAQDDGTSPASSSSGTA